MAYLRCYDCNWGQDDYWNKDYNPFTFQSNQDFIEEMLNAKSLDDIYLYKVRWDNNSFEFYTPEQYKTHLNDYGKFDGITIIYTYRSYAVMIFENQIQRLKTMHYHTKQAWLESKEPICPMCGGNIIED
jgi:hypothetical protein